MSDNKDDNKKEKTYSEAFEKFEKTRHSDKSSNLFFGLLDTMEEDFREEQAEKYRQMFHAVDLIDRALKEAMNSNAGREAIKREILKRTGKNVK